MKDCQFCGSKAELIKRKPLKGDLPYAIACTSGVTKECFLYSGSEERQLHDPRAWDDVLQWYAKEEEAINAWNTRPAKDGLVGTEELPKAELDEKEVLIMLNKNKNYDDEICDELKEQFTYLIKNKDWDGLTKMMRISVDLTRREDAKTICQHFKPANPSIPSCLVKCSKCGNETNKDECTYFCYENGSNQNLNTIICPNCIQALLSKERG